MNDNYWKTVSLLLFMLVLIGVGYLGTDYYQTRVTDIYAEGYTAAGTDFGAYLLDLGLKCETIDLLYDTNKTINLIAVQCLPEEVIQYMQQQAVQNG